MSNHKRVWTSIRCIGVLLVFLTSLAFGGINEKDKTKGLEKTTTNDLYRPFLINNIFNYYGNNGDGSYNKFSTDNEGFEFLKGDGKHIIFEDGVVWGGYHKGRTTPTVGGSVYRHGLQAGRIVTPGTATTIPTADDASLSLYRVYRVRPDINPATPYSQVESKIENEEVRFIGRFEGFTAREIYDQYIADWNEWPASMGAPYTDVDTNGSYNPTVDIPGQPLSDQTLWYIANDMNATRVNSLSGSPSIGVEMHRTIWGYKRSGALGQTIFMSTLIVNKSGAPIDSMYFVQWSDPDLGDAGDDFVGCDTTRSLGYVYNDGSDGTFGTAVPAGGFDFFQGPLLPSVGDTAIFRLKKRANFKNLGMTAFVFFTQGNPTYRDPVQGAGGDIEWYRLMKGTVASSGAEFIDAVTGLPTKYCLSGDPVTTGTPGDHGWVDGMNGITSQDRRMVMVTGPFTMAVGDTQELVVAAIGGVGADQLSSISELRSVSDKAQLAYNNLFKLPAPPPSPVVEVAEMDGEVILTWGDPKGIAKTEGTIDQGFEFEGYNVYEYPGASTAGAILLGTWDRVNGITTVVDTLRDISTGLFIPTVLQRGTDNGQIRSISLRSSKVTGGSMVNGSRYFFAVTAYSYNPDPPATAGTHSLESAPQVLAVTPQTPNPGYRYAPTGDTLTATHTGASDGRALARIVNPKVLTGGTYRIVFGTTGGNPVWHVVRTIGSQTDTVARDIVGQDGTNDQAVVIDGIEFRVFGAPNDFKDFLVVRNGAGALTPPQYGAFAFNASGFPHPTTGDRPNGTLQQSGGVLTASQGWGIHTGMNSATMPLSYTNFVSRVTQGGSRWPHIVPFDFEIRFTAAGGSAWNAYTDETATTVPFELWNIGMNTPNDASDDYRLYPYLLDVDGNGQWNVMTQAGVDTVDNGTGLHVASHSISGGANDPFSDWVYWVKPANTAPGQAGYDAIAAEVAAGTHAYLGASTAAIEPLRRMVLVGWNLGGVAAGTYPQPYPQVGTVFRIISTKPNTPADSYSIQAPAASSDADLAVEDVQKINVFPNPYIGFNPQEQNKYARFVTFTHMPPKATLRIFNIAGLLIRTLQKNDASQFFTWDLNNTAGFPASAGMYIVHIDMPDLGVTKILKLGVIPEQQYLDRW